MNKGMWCQSWPEINAGTTPQTPVGYAQPLAGVPGVYTFDFANAIGGPLTLSDGSHFQVPSVGWWSMDGKRLEGLGVTPDVVVAETAEDRRLSRSERKALRKLHRQELVKRSMLIKILFAWLITLPVAGIFAAISYRLTEALALNPF